MKPKLSCRHGGRDGAAPKIQQNYWQEPPQAVEKSQEGGPLGSARSDPRGGHGIYKQGEFAASLKKHRNFCHKWALAPASWSLALLFTRCCSMNLADKILDGRAILSSLLSTSRKGRDRPCCNPLEHGQSDGGHTGGTDLLHPGTKQGEKLS